MPTVLFAVPVLVLGAFFALAGRSNSQRALAALLTQAIASIAVASAVLPVLRGGSALSLAWSSSSPLGLVVFRVDALGAFFLVWSLPMTFLGTLYAVGYLRAHFDAGRNGGPHFALLNMVSLSFVVIYSVQDALVFLFGWEIAPSRRGSSSSGTTGARRSASQASTTSSPPMSASSCSSQPSCSCTARRAR